MTNSLFKKIYFIVMALVAVLIFTLTATTYYFSVSSTDLNENATTIARSLSQRERNAMNADGHKAAADLIEASIKSYGFTDLGTRRASTNQELPNYTKLTNVSSHTSVKASYVVQDFTRDDGDFANLAVDTSTTFDMFGNSNQVYGAAEPKNFIVVIKGEGTESAATGTKNAVMLMTHYDSKAKSNGYTNAVNVASMLETIRLAKDKTFANDIVFVFTDGRFNDSVGAFAFKNQFIGYNNIFNRIGAAFNFDALSAGGKLTLMQSSADDAAIVSAYQSCAGSTYTDSVLTSLTTDFVTSDFDIFYSKENKNWLAPSLNFMYFGGAEDADSRLDTAANVDEEAVAAQSLQLMNALTEKFGNIDLANLRGGGAGVYASVLGGAVTGSTVFSYIMATILLLAACGILFLSQKRKIWNASSVLKGAGIAFGLVATSIALFFAAYFLISLLCVAFGVIALEMVVTFQFLSLAVLIPAMLFAGAVTCGLWSLFKRIAKVKATDCARGSSLLLILITVIIGYAAAAAAMQALIAGIIITIVMFASVMLKPVIKTKFNLDIERFMPYAWAMIFCLPFLLPIVLTVCNVFGIIFLPLFAGFFALLFSCITPYFDFLINPLAKAFAKLPKHKVVYDAEVTRTVSDEAKLGKYHEVTTKNVFTKKVIWKYHNWFGVTVLTVVTAVVLLLCSILGAFGAVRYGSSVATSYNFTNDNNFEAIYSNSMVYHIEKSASTISSASLLVKDTSLYTKTRNVPTDGGRYFMGDFSWNENLDGYSMPLPMGGNHPISAEAVVVTRGTLTDDVKTLDVSPIISARSQVTLALSGLSGVTRIDIRRSSGDEYTLKYDTAINSTTITLPYAFGNCSIGIHTSSSSSISVTTTEYVFDGQRLRTSEVVLPYVTAFDEHFKGSDWSIDYGMVIRTSHSISLGS